MTDFRAVIGAAVERIYNLRLEPSVEVISPAEYQRRLLHKDGCLGQYGAHSRCTCGALTEEGDQQ